MNQDEVPLTVVMALVIFFAIALPVILYFLNMWWNFWLGSRI